MPKLIADHFVVCARCWATAGLDDTEEITLGLVGDRPCFICGLMLIPAMEYHWMPRCIAENERALFRDHHKFVGSIKEEDRSLGVPMDAPSRHRRVRITKCDLDTSWYHGLEGEEFEVCTFGNTYVLLEDYNNRNKHPGVPWRHILVDDCEVLGMLYTAESGKTVSRSSLLPG